MRETVHFLKVTVLLGLTVLVMAARCEGGREESTVPRIVTTTDVFEDGYKAKHVPCDFLRDDGECMLGECRPVSCKLYPYTDQEGRLEGLLSMIDNTEICPVVYHIYEDLKKIYGFR